jgi:hypothetical protein
MEQFSLFHPASSILSAMAEKFNPPYPGPASARTSSPTPKLIGAHDFYGFKHIIRPGGFRIGADSQPGEDQFLPVEQPAFTCQCPDTGDVLRDFDAALITSTLIIQREIANMDKHFIHLDPEFSGILLALSE